MAKHLGCTRMSWALWLLQAARLVSWRSRHYPEPIKVEKTCPGWLLSHVKTAKALIKSADLDDQCHFAEGQASLVSCRSPHETPGIDIVVQTSARYLIHTTTSQGVVMSNISQNVI